MKLELINTSRKGWIDALRGLAILLVMYGHCIENMPGYFIFTSPFKMPLFFAITGYVFVVGSNNDTKSFFSQLFRKVFVPWMILGLIPAVLLIPLKGFENLVNAFLRLLSGEDLWFMPCFFIGEIIWYCILRGCKKTVWISIAALCCFVIGLVLHRNGILNYAMFNRALAVQPFFLVGFLFRQHEESICDVKWPWITASVLLYIVLCFLSMLLFPGESLDVHLNHYYNIPFCLVLIFLGCMILFTTARKSDFHSSFMSFIGQNTLVLYIWHFYFIEILVKGCSLLGLTIPVNWWSAIIKVIWACMVGGVCAILLNRYCPFVVGKKRKKV